MALAELRRFPMLPFISTRTREHVYQPKTAFSNHPLTEAVRGLWGSLTDRVRQGDPDARFFFLFFGGMSGLGLASAIGLTVMLRTGMAWTNCGIIEPLIYAASVVHGLVARQAYIDMGRVNTEVSNHSPLD